MLVPKLKKDALAGIHKYMKNSIKFNDQAVAQLNKGKMDVDEKEPITMEQVVEMANLIYDNIPQHNCGMRDFLMRYTADRMHENRECDKCGGSPQSTTGYNKLDPWEPGSMRVFVEGVPQEFLCSVLTISLQMLEL